MIVETQRLYLREMNQEDFGDLCEMLQDEAVMHAYEHAFSQEEAQEWLDRQIARYRKYGFGLWATVRKDTGEMVGQVGLTMQPCDGEEVLEIGYLLKKKHWKKGYAREAAVGCKKYAFEVLDQDRVYCIIRDNNLASQRVAEHLGMERQKTIVKHYYHMDMPHYVYSVKREQL